MYSAWFCHCVGADFEQSQGDIGLSQPWRPIDQTGEESVKSHQLHVALKINRTVGINRPNVCERLLVLQATTCISNECAPVEGSGIVTLHLGPYSLTIHPVKDEKEILFMGMAS